MVVATKQLWLMCSFLSCCPQLWLFLLLVFQLDLKEYDLLKNPKIFPVYPISYLLRMVVVSSWLEDLDSDIENL